MIRYRPFFPNSLFYPCSAFDGYLIRLINSQPDKFKTANFVHVDIGDYSIINPGDIEKTSALFNKFKSKLDEIPYYNFESTQVILENKKLTNSPFVSVLYRGTKKVIFKGKAGHDSIYVMFALGDAFDFYQTIYFEQNTMPLIFAEKYGKVDFRTEIIQGNLSSKWIISDKLSPGDEITGYQKEETNLHTRWDHSLEIFKRQ